MCFGTITRHASLEYLQATGEDIQRGGGSSACRAYAYIFTWEVVCVVVCTVVVQYVFLPGGSRRARERASRQIVIESAPAAPEVERRQAWA